jgi:hypothetical protein
MEEYRRKDSVTKLWNSSNRSLRNRELKNPDGEHGNSAKRHFQNEWRRPGAGCWTLNDSRSKTSRTHSSDFQHKRPVPGQQSGSRDTAGHVHTSLCGGPVRRSVLPAADRMGDHCAEGSHRDVSSVQVCTSSVQKWSTVSHPYQYASPTSR